jgi:2-C-methyl-D-erythritol 4-phosphate cytidylyltransferase
MRSEQPKQYLPLLGQPLIRHTLGVLCDSPVIDRVYVVLSVGDQEWDRHDWSSFGDRLVPLFCGGASRADSVLNGLRAIADDASEGDWVLVHDAARPCLAPWHIETLVRELMHDEVGGILAVPVADTLKREDSTHRIAATVPRDGLWQAQTPQMFRYVMLKRALETARTSPTRPAPSRPWACARAWCGATPPTSKSPSPRPASGRVDSPAPRGLKMHVPFRIGQGFDVHALVPGRP